MNPEPEIKDNKISLAGTPLDFRHLVLVLRERWLGAAGLVFLVCGLVGYAMLSRPPVFEAQAGLLVEKTGDRVVEMKQVVDNTVEGSLTDTLLLTHIEQMKSRTFIDRVINSLTVTERESLLREYPEEDLTPQDMALPKDLRNKARLLGLLSNGYSVSRSARTLLIRISVRHRNAVSAQFLANRIGDQYILSLIDRTNYSNTAAMSFLQTQTEELRQKVEKAERDLQAYRNKYNLVSLEDNQNIIVERLKSLNTSATQARVQRLSLEAKLQQVEKVLAEKGDPMQLASLTEFASLKTVQQQIDELNTQRTVLAERYGKKHPKMVENARALDSLQKLRAQQIQAALADLRHQVDKAKTEETQLNAELAAAEQESLRLDQLTVGYSALRREVDTARTTYSQVLARQNETNVTSQLQNTNIKFVDRAALPDLPVFPNKKLVAAILLVLALGLGLGYPLAADALDQRIKTWADVEGYLGSTLLGEIPSLPKVQESDRDSVVLKELDEGSTEAFRGLYSQLSLSSKVPLPKTIIVTSTIPGEGKSFVSCNLAASFAKHGKKVLLMDGDFRRPSLHRAFSHNNQAGAITWLESGEPLPENILADEKLGFVDIAPNFKLLRAGGVSRRATEILEGARIVELLETLQRQFDLVIIDTPPAGVFPDAEAFARLADELIYVCRFNGVTRPQVRQVLNRLQKTDLAFPGVVLNAMPSGRAGYYYYHSSYGYYGYKYYKSYHDDSPGSGA